MTDIRQDMINFILSKSPVSFSKEHWLGVKMSPHKRIEFINEVGEQVKTSESIYSLSECSDQIISTIYQRLKLNEKLSK